MSRGIRICTGNNQWKNANNSIRILGNNGWQKAKVRAWDGYNWQLLSEERHQDTWSCAWSNGYWSWGAAKPRTSLQPSYRPQCGAYTPFHDMYDRGSGLGMFGFDDGDIRNKLSGSRIEKVELYIHETHMAYFNKGCTVLGTHNARGWQARFQETNYEVSRVYWGRRNQGQWITLPNWIGENFRDNWLSGFTTHVKSNDWYYYTILAGVFDGWMAPKLRITYWK